MSCTSESARMRSRLRRLVLFFPTVRATHGASVPHNQAAAKELCVSNKTGDFSYSACGAANHQSSFCKPEKAEEVCSYCKCRACDFCRTALTSPPPPASPGASRPCKSWCDTHPEPWTFKCFSFPSCRGCDACSEMPNPPPPPTPLFSPPEAPPPKASSPEQPRAALPQEGSAPEPQTSHPQLPVFVTAKCHWGGRENALDLQPPRHCTHFNSSELCHKFYTASGLCEWQSGVGSFEAACRTSSVCKKRKQEQEARRAPSPPIPPPLMCSSWCELNTNPWSFKCTSYPSCRGCTTCFEPPPMPLVGGRQPLVTRLNQRFSRGVPSNDLNEAGVLVHVLDKTEDPKRSWMPCRSGWCASYGDRISSTIINPGQPGIWKGGVGFVLSPAFARVRCSYSDDGGSMRQPGGCSPTPCSVQYPWKCSWSANELREMMTHQRTARGGEGYNEVIIEAHDADWKLPYIIEGIFETQIGHGKAVHESFLSTYGLNAAEFPLLRLDTRGRVASPFSVALDR